MTESGVFFDKKRGWSGGGMMLDKFPVPRRRTNLDNSRARTYCAYSRYEWRCWNNLSLVSYFFPPLLGKRLHID